MEVLYEEKVVINQNTAIALGSFDGVHKGHQEIIDILIKESKKLNYKSVIFTFSNHPSEILEGKKPVKKIMDNEQKEKIFRELGVDYTYFRPFTERFLKLKPEEFIEEVLVKQMKAKLIVVGFNFRFGYKGSGDVNTLKRFGSIYNYEVITVPPVIIDHNTVSSTFIRKKLLDGEVEVASMLLGRPYSIKNIVQEGKKIGRTIGFPTINLKSEENRIIPKNGIYISKTFIHQRIYNSVTNIGYNPTFNGKDIIIETYIFDFKDNVYGEVAEVYFLKRIRGEEKFSAIEELVLQIKKDVEIAKGYFENMNTKDI